MATKIAKPPALAAATTTAGEEKVENIRDVLNSAILWSISISEAAREADSFKSECSVLKNLAENIAEMIRTTHRITTASGPGSFYERPIWQIVTEVIKVLEKTLRLVEKCKRGNVLRRVMSIVSAADFKKLHTLLENSVSDMTWLLNILDGSGGITLSPFATNDPIISWVWPSIGSLYVGQFSDKIEASNRLASLAKDNDRNKKYIVQEGGIPPLLKLLKETSSVDVQNAAATALVHIANDEERVSVIISELGVPVIVRALGDSPMNLQIKLANLVARMAQHSKPAQEDFATANVIKPVVTLLSIDSSIDERNLKVGKPSFHSILEINNEMERNQLHRPALVSSLSMQSSNGGSSRGGHHKKERENETPEMKLSLKTSCAEALWMLARGSVLNSKRITETKGLLCLAKIVEKEEGELLFNSLMTIMEITIAAESNDDLRRAAFRTNSLAAKAVVDELLRVIKEHADLQLQRPAIRAIGCLARTFPARDTRVIGPLVEQLSHRNQDVATEAAIALCKFASSENFLHVQHSKSIIEFKGVLPLLRLLKGNERSQFHGLLLICYLALHAPNNDTLEPWVLTNIVGADRTLFAQYPELIELRNDAIRKLSIFNSGVLHQRQASALGNEGY